MNQCTTSAVRFGQLQDELSWSSLDQHGGFGRQPPHGIPAVAETAEEGLPELPSPDMGSRMLHEPVLKKHGLIVCLRGKNQTILQV